jgi:hypothetical protein
MRRARWTDCRRCLDGLKTKCLTSQSHWRLWRLMNLSKNGSTNAAYVASRPYAKGSHRTDFEHFQGGLLRTIAAIRTICDKDEYDVWRPFAGVVVAAIPCIREEGMEKMLQQKRAWRSFWLSHNLDFVMADLMRIMSDVGHKDISGEILCPCSGPSFASAEYNSSDDLSAQSRALRSRALRLQAASPSATSEVPVLSTNSEIP